MLGTTVGKYRITAKLGEGGMGVVYEARNDELDKRAVIKMLRPNLSSNQNISQRFVQEAKAAGSICHPGIVDVFDIDRHDNGCLYIVMEYLDGETLANRLHTVGKLPQTMAVSFTRQAARALGAAHERGIVHRDLKPENLFLVPDPEVVGGERVKLLDFGTAKLLEGGGGLTVSGLIMGTPPYMSPEQCRGSGRVDHRSDLYSLGVLLYEMLCGRLPFVKRNQAEFIAAHLTEKPPPIEQYEPSISPPLIGVLARLLAKTPGGRYASADEFLAALDSAAGLDAFSGFDEAAMTRPLGSLRVRDLAAQDLDGSDLRRDPGAFGDRILTPTEMIDLHARRPPVARSQRPGSQAHRPPGPTPGSGSMPRPISGARLRVGPGVGSGVAPGAGLGSGPGSVSTAHPVPGRAPRPTPAAVAAPAERGARPRPRSSSHPPYKTGSAPSPIEPYSSRPEAASQSQLGSSASALPAPAKAPPSALKPYDTNPSHDTSKAKAHPPVVGPSSDAKRTARPVKSRPRQSGWLLPFTIAAIVAASLGTAGYFVWPKFVRSEASGGRADAGAATRTETGPQPGGKGDGIDVVHVALADVAPLRFVALPGGQFTMGSPESEDGRVTNERPHQVRVSAFALAADEVTQKQWQVVMGTNPSDCDSGCSEDRPVQNVTWLEAIQFLNRLSEREKLEPCYTFRGGGGDRVAWKRPCSGYRLPTEAEWEYACRAGMQTAYGFNGSESAVAKYAWFIDNVDDRKVKPVHTRSPNTWGLYDMHGNVWEWVWDSYGPYSVTVGATGQGESVADNPTGPDAPTGQRSLRGGSVRSGSWDMRCAKRHTQVASYRSPENGFRCARDLPETEDSGAAAGGGDPQ